MSGSHRSHFGKYQLRSSSRAMTAGSSTPRMIVASISTAAARPTPICFMDCIDSVPKIANTATMITAALVTTPAVVTTPWAMASRVLRPWRRASRIRETTNTW